MRLLDVGMDGRDTNIRIEIFDALSCDLRAKIRTSSLVHNGGETYQRLALFHVLFSEEELAIEIRQVNGVKVQQRNVSESSEDDVLHCK